MVRLLGSALSVSLVVLTLEAASGANLRAVVASGSGGPLLVTSCALQPNTTADGFPHARIALKNGGDKNVAAAHLGLTFFRVDGGRRTQTGRTVVTWPTEGVDAIEPGGTAAYDAQVESTVPPSSNEVACSVVDAQFEDGTSWSAPAAPRPTAPARAVATRDDRLWLGVGTSANPLVNGTPKYCTKNQVVAAWATEACHFARLAWAEQHAVAQSAPAKPRPPAAKAHSPAPQPQIARAASPSTLAPRATPEPTPAPDDAAPGEEPMATPTPAPVALLPEPTAPPAVAPTPQARATRPSYASGPANPMWQRMSGGAAPPRAATPAPEVAPAEAEPPVAAPPVAAPPIDAPRAVARTADRDAPPVPSDVLAIRYTPSTKFAWSASKAFSACFGTAGGAEPLAALSDALAAKDTQEAVDAANRVYAVARPCDRTEASSAVGVSELAVLQSWLYAERSFWTYADLKLRIAQTELDTASHRDGFAAIDAARIARLRATIASLKTVLAAHPE